MIFISSFFYATFKIQLYLKCTISFNINSIVLASVCTILNKSTLQNIQPTRIISLVPSQTELLHYLGLENEVIAITKFCIHPFNWFKNKITELLNK